MKKLHHIIFGVALMLLAACSEMGLQPAQTVDQKLAYSYATVTAVRMSAAGALTAGTIKVEDAQQVLTATDQVRALLDESRTLEAAGNPSTALQKLTLATDVLMQVQQYLAAKGVK